MAIATERLARERRFHDQQAQQRALRHVHRPETLRFDIDWYLDHESWIRPALAKLGNVRGRRVLDLGCGHGMAAVVLAAWGAQVTALELSADYLKEAAARAAAHDVSLQLVQANAEHLPFLDQSFDCVWGNAILHHLDIDQAGRELRRVLAPGGSAVFCEPWGENPLLRLARRHLPYSGKEHTADEEPLGRQQVCTLRRIFPSVTVEGHQLLSMVRRAVGRRITSLEQCDHWLLARYPSLRRFCRYVVLTLRK